MNDAARESREHFIRRHVHNATRFGEAYRAYDMGQCDMCRNNNARCFSTIFRYTNKRSGKDYSFNICDGCNDFDYQTVKSDFAVLQFSLASSVDTYVDIIHCDVCKTDYRRKVRYYYGNGITVCSQCIDKTDYKSRPIAYYRHTYYEESFFIQSCIHCGASPVFFKIDGKPHCKEHLPERTIIVTTELSNYAGD